MVTVAWNVSLLASGDRFDSVNESPDTRLPGYAILDARVRYQVDRRWSVELSATNVPSKQVGGDYYDVLPAKDGCWIAIGDVNSDGLRDWCRSSGFRTGHRELHAEAKLGGLIEIIGLGDGHVFGPFQDLRIDHIGDDCLRARVKRTLVEHDAVAGALAGQLHPRLGFPVGRDLRDVGRLLQRDEVQVPGRVARRSFDSRGEAVLLRQRFRDEEFVLVRGARDGAQRERGEGK